MWKHLPTGYYAMWSTVCNRIKGQPLWDSGHEVQWQETTQRNRMAIIWGWAEWGTEGLFRNYAEVHVSKMKRILKTGAGDGWSVVMRRQMLRCVWSVQLRKRECTQSIFLHLHSNPDPCMEMPPSRMARTHMEFQPLSPLLEPCPWHGLPPFACGVLASSNRDATLVMEKSHIIGVHLLDTTKN